MGFIQSNWIFSFSALPFNSHYLEMCGSLWCLLLLFYHCLWRFIPRVGDGQGSLASCSPWGCKELDMTERLNWTETVNNNLNLLIQLYVKCNIFQHAKSKWNPSIPMSSPLRPCDTHLPSYWMKAQVSTSSLTLIKSHFFKLKKKFSQCFLPIPQHCFIQALT